MFAAEVVANHDDRWLQQVSTVALDFDGVELAVSTGEPGSIGPQVAVPLYLSITGNRIPSPVFASFSGYGTSERAAIVEGACLWTCSFVPVLRRAYGSGPPVDDVREESVTVEGTEFRLYSADLGRALMEDDGDPQDRIRETRERFVPDEVSLSAVVAGFGTLPVLSATTPTVLSVFVGDIPGNRVVEVKVNGSDWPLATREFDTVPPQPPGANVLLREFAVLVPVPSAAPGGGPGPPGPSRAAVERTLAGLAGRQGDPLSASGWPGWAAHGGRLGPPLPASELARFPDLPPAYVSLMETVGAPGAGPGYGMLRPRLVGDVVPLAHAGCGCTWVLRLDARHRGEVWADASGSDESYTKVAGSALEWYQAFLDHAVANRGPWIHWNNASCSPANLFNDLLQRADLPRTPDGKPDLSGAIRPGGLSIAGGGAYLEGSHAMDPCHGCVALAANLGLDPSIFAPGVLSSPGSVPGA